LDCCPPKNKENKHKRNNLELLWNKVALLENIEDRKELI
jgi:hypothetical protein